MSSVQQHAPRRIPATIISLACHAAGLGLLLAGATRSILNEPKPSMSWRVAALQVAGGSRAVRLPLPEALAASRSAKHPSIRDPITRPASPPRERRPAKASGTNAAAARPLDIGTNTVAGKGSDAQNTTPAFPIFYPNPAVHDRTLLPATERHVVVDVQLNVGGEVVSENLVKGMGNDLDRMAIEIVKTWRFQPATANGNAIPSEAEVIFTFSQRYPISDS